VFADVTIPGVFEALEPDVAIIAGEGLGDMRSVSPFTRSSIASTSHAGVKTSPWSATRCLDFTRLISNAVSAYLNHLLRRSPLTRCKASDNPLH
jgi:hypothetical protein